MDDLTTDVAARDIELRSSGYELCEKGSFTRDEARYEIASNSKAAGHDRDVRRCYESSFRRITETIKTMPRETHRYKDMLFSVEKYVAESLFSGSRANAVMGRRRIVRR